jgi:hypothetical protein
MKTMPRIVIVGAILSLIAVVAVVVASGADPRPAHGSADAATARTGGGWRTNARGQTLGRLHGDELYGEMPDLVCAMATNGKIGYCMKSDLFGYELGRPKAATIMGRMVPVYRSDGITKIGHFLASSGL